MQNQVKELVRSISLKLNNSSVQGKDQAAWWLLEKLSSKSKSGLLAQNSFDLDFEQEKLLQTWLNKLTQENYPIQYLLGSVPFLGLDILVEPPILIPRPETEEWVANLIDQLKDHKKEPLRILDIGTGSGCIALSLAKAFPKAKVYAADLSREALALTEKNKKHNKIKNLVTIHSDLFESLPGKQFDLIVSNPPYIAEKHKPFLDKSVIKWEDSQALFAGEDGLDAIKKIILKSRGFLKSIFKGLPLLVLEIDIDQEKAVKVLLEESGFSQIKVLNDFTNRPRCVISYF